MAAQFTSEGATLSGVDLELVGSGYRMSLVKRRFATGMPPPIRLLRLPGAGPPASARVRGEGEELGRLGRSVGVGPWRPRLVGSSGEG